MDKQYDNIFTFGDDHIQIFQYPILSEILQKLLVNVSQIVLIISL